MHNTMEQGKVIGCGQGYCECCIQYYLDDRCDFCYVGLNPDNVRELLTSISVSGGSKDRLRRRLADYGF